MYRPKGLVNPYRGKVEQGCFEFQVFERAINATIEALLKSDEPSCEVFETTVMDMAGQESGPVRAYGKSYPGKWVFIPEEVADGLET